MLCSAERTVCAVLRVMGLSAEKHFQNYHRVLQHAGWSSLEASHLLWGLLIHAFAIRGPVVMGLDNTIERRRGVRIKAKGIYRDPVRSTHSHFVKASGLRWLSLMLLAPVPWVKRVWVLPFLTVLAPSERSCKFVAGCPTTVWWLWQPAVLRSLNCSGNSASDKIRSV
jgi:DDE superfamily endonuclease